MIRKRDLLVMVIALNHQNGVERRSLQRSGLLEAFNTRAERWMKKRNFVTVGKFHDGRVMYTITPEGRMYAQLKGLTNREGGLR